MALYKFCIIIIIINYYNYAKPATIPIRLGLNKVCMGPVAGDIDCPPQALGVKTPSKTQTDNDTSVCALCLSGGAKRHAS